MADVERLFAEFVETDLAGEAPDAREYVDRVAGDERAQLAELIDAYYMDAPPRPWDPEAFRGSAAEGLTDEIDRSFRGRAGLWPALLPRLRNRVELKRRELVGRLADALDVGDRADKVGDYYHQMEQGTLPAEGVSDRVLEALGGLLGTSAGALRWASRTLTIDVGGGDAESVFARTAHPDPTLADEAETAAPAASSPAPPDEVDELFTGRSEGP